MGRPAPDGSRLDAGLPGRLGLWRILMQVDPLGRVRIRNGSLRAAVGSAEPLLRGGIVKGIIADDKPLLSVSGGRPRVNKEMDT